MIHTKLLRSMVDAAHFENLANFVIGSLLDHLEAAEKARDDLLEALETLSKMAEAFPSELREKHPDVVAARAAIAKAPGDQI